MADAATKTLSLKHLVHFGDGIVAIFPAGEAMPDEVRALLEVCRQLRAFIRDLPVFGVRNRQHQVKQSPLCCNILPSHVDHRKGLCPEDSACCLCDNGNYTDRSHILIDWLNDFGFDMAALSTSLKAFPQSSVADGQTVLSELISDIAHANEVGEFLDMLYLLYRFGDKRGGGRQNLCLREQYNWCLRQDMEVSTVRDRVLSLELLCVDPTIIVDDVLKDNTVLLLMTGSPPSRDLANVSRLFSKHCGLPPLTHHVTTLVDTTLGNGTFRAIQFTPMLGVGNSQRTPVRYVKKELSMREGNNGREVALELIHIMSLCAEASIDVVAKSRSWIKPDGALTMCVDSHSDCLCHVGTDDISLILVGTTKGKLILVFGPSVSKMRMIQRHWTALPTGPYNSTVPISKGYGSWQRIVASYFSSLELQNAEFIDTTAKISDIDAALAAGRTVIAFRSAQ